MSTPTFTLVHTCPSRVHSTQCFTNTRGTPTCCRVAPDIGKLSISFSALVAACSVANATWRQNCSPDKWDPYHKKGRGGAKSRRCMDGFISWMVGRSASPPPSIDNLRTPARRWLDRDAGPQTQRQCGRCVVTGTRPPLAELQCSLPMLSNVALHRAPGLASSESGSRR